MKKINIATLWNAQNYGAYLQAYALSSYCKSLGYEVSMLKECIEPRSYLAEISRDLKKFLYQVRLHKNFKIAQKFFKISESSEQVYATIAGADEIWNVNNHFFKHIPIYVGRNKNATLNISYAPSANGASATDFISCYGDTPLSSFDSISVRDLSTQQLVEKILTGKQIPVVLDPTFLLDNYNDMAKNINISNYIFIYGYGFSKQEIVEIKQFARETGKILISAGPYHNWTDRQMPGGPDIFLGFVKNADYVITSTFHGTVFSIIFNKQFVSYCRNNIKIIELLDKFNLKARNVSANELALTFNNTINYMLVNKLVEKMRTESINYLKTALREK